MSVSTNGLLILRDAFLRRLVHKTAPARLMAGLPARWFGPDHKSDADWIFVGGSMRSGTSILRETLGRHRRLAIGPETALFSQRPNLHKLAHYLDMDVRALADMVRAAPSLTHFADSLFQLRLTATGKPRYVDKTPANVEAISKILQLYPRARFIHMLRDGRDVACSLRTFNAYGWNGFFKSSAKDGVHRTIADGAALWRWYASNGLAHRGHPRCLEVRYEDLMANPRAELERICAFVGEEFDPAMLSSEPAPDSDVLRKRFNANPAAGQGINPASVGRWRRDMSPAEQLEFCHAAGALLIASGYESDDSWIMR